MNKGWRKDYHRHYLAAKYGEAPGKINMRSGGDLIAASNALGQRLSISNAMDEGTKVIPAAIAAGEGTNAKSRNAGFYETDAANHTATHYLAKEGHVDKPKYEHAPWLKTKKQIEAFEEKTGRKHKGESTAHYLNREATEEVDEEKEPELYMARKLSSSEIDELSSRPGVKKVAVENYLSTLSGDKMADSMNLSSDAASYKWNPATVKAIREGIDRAK
jgi:hypothetical protein